MHETVKVTTEGRMARPKSWMLVVLVLQVYVPTDSTAAHQGMAKYPNRFRHVCDILLPGNIRKDCTNGQQAKPIQRSSSSFKKIADHKVA